MGFYMSECYLCGVKLMNRNRSKDHVPPDCIFPKNKPKNLITIPCCSSCNQGYKQLDEKMRNHIALLAVNQSGEVGGKAKKEILRSWKLRNEFIKKMKEHPTLKDDKGNPRYLFYFNDSELESWFIRLTKGLHFRKYKQRINNKAKFEVRKHPELSPQPSETFPMEGGLEFRPYFVYGVIEEENNNFWVFIFYDHLIFTVSVNTESGEIGK
jgi:hypothetical protein